MYATLMFALKLFFGLPLCSRSINVYPGCMTSQWRLEIYPNHGYGESDVVNEEVIPRWKRRFGGKNVQGA